MNYGKAFSVVTFTDDVAVLHTNELATAIDACAGSAEKFGIRSHVVDNSTGEVLMIVDPTGECGYYYSGVVCDLINERKEKEEIRSIITALAIANVLDGLDEILEELL